VSPSKDDYISFEKALAELNLREEDLRRMVSEGDIRAFREGASMKFRREDVDAMAQQRKGEEDLMFADSLEDDTGMVTEEISEEDTLLAEDDVEETRPVRAPVRARSARVAAATAATTEEGSEPGWVTAVAIVSCLVCVYGLFVLYSIAAHTPPGGLTGLFAGPIE
jgi:excisionase family DNA binding protein